MSIFIDGACEDVRNSCPDSALAIAAELRSILTPVQIELGMFLESAHAPYLLDTDTISEAIDRINAIADAIGPIKAKAV